MFLLHNLNLLLFAHSLKHLFRYLFLIFDLIIIRMAWRSIIRPYDETRDLKVALDIAIVRDVWVRQSQPLTIKLMIEALVHSGQADTKLADQVIFQHGIVVKDFKYKLESLKLVLVHHQAGKCE